MNIHRSIYRKLNDPMIVFVYCTTGDMIMSYATKIQVGTPKHAINKSWDIATLYALAWNARQRGTSLYAMKTHIIQK